jgi:broad specificity phosphatase PhoE
MVGLLIRHGHAAPEDRSLAGRRAAVPLDDVGREQAHVLAHALTWLTLSGVYSSPVEGAVETAFPLANDHGLDVRVRPALTDVDFAGEPLADVQRRVVAELMTLAKSHQGETVAIVTHDEPIRCALAAFSGRTLDDIMNVEISPTHVSAIGITPSGICEVLGVNLTALEVTV